MGYKADVRNACAYRVLPFRFTATYRFAFEWQRAVPEAQESTTTTTSAMKEIVRY